MGPGKMGLTKKRDEPIVKTIHKCTLMIHIVISTVHRKYRQKSMVPIVHKISNKEKTE